MIAAREFREDLYYRLRVVEVHLPALRSRREDLPRLVRYFLGRFAAREGKGPRTLTSTGACPGQEERLHKQSHPLGWLLNGIVPQVICRMLAMGHQSTDLIVARPQSGRDLCRPRRHAGGVQRGSTFGRTPGVSSLMLPTGWFPGGFDRSAGASLSHPDGALRAPRRCDKMRQAGCH